MFDNEEKLVAEKFILTFPDHRRTVLDILKATEELLRNSTVGADDYATYAAVILAGSAFKTLISGYDRLSKGYLSDAEALIKKSIEGLFYQLYFHTNHEDAKTWCIYNKKPDLRRGLKTLAHKLDELQKEKQIFPTDYDNFFTELIHESGYGQSNRFAHLDFDTVHFEIGLENMDPTQFATTMVIGPKFEEALMKTTLNRLIMFSMFQATVLLYVSDQEPTDEYRKVFHQVNELFNGLSTE